jgi:hypothetical protein
VAKSFSVKSASPHSGKPSRAVLNQVNPWDEAVVLLKTLQTDWSNLAAIKWLPLGMSTIGILLLWRLNGLLLLTLLCGAAMGSLTYGMVKERQYPRWRSILAGLQKGKTPLGMSVGVGVLTLTLSYSAIAVWQDLQSPWLALMLLTQEVGLMMVLGLVLWSVVSRPKAEPSLNFDRCVAGLLHRDELRRLMAVRQLAQMQDKNALSQQQQSMAVEYLQLLAERETSPIIGRAIQESLSSLAPYPQLSDRSSASDRVLMQYPKVKESQVNAVRIKQTVS